VAADQPNLWFVFFDGEEAMVQFSDTDGLWGSKFFVDNLKRKDQVKDIKAMILLDMVGDKNLKVTVAGTIGQKVFDAARAAGFRDYFNYGVNAILDDHVPFERAGIRRLTSLMPISSNSTMEIRQAPENTGIQRETRSTRSDRIALRLSAKPPCG